MKEKFETNVAEDMPKIRTQEPGLPWKLTDDELEQIGPQDEEYRSAIAPTPPLRTRAIFPIMLVLLYSWLFYTLW